MRNSVIGFAALFCVAACSEQAADSVSDAPDVTGSYENVELALEETLVRLYTDNAFPGIQAAIVLPDGTVIEAAAGLADLEDQTPMATHLRLASGSIGKTYVAAAVMALVEEERLSLEARVIDYLSDASWYEGFPNGETITVGQLLNHSSGVPNDYIAHPELLAALERSVTEGLDIADQGISHEDYVRWVTGQPPAFLPGEGFGYSDVAFTVGALLVEHITGRSLEDEVEERFLAPFGLSDTEPLARTMDRFVSAYVPEPVRQSFPAVPEKSTDKGAFKFDPRIEWGGGGYVATAPGLARWGKIWFSGAALEMEYVTMLREWANPHSPEQLGDAFSIGAQLRYQSEFGERFYHGGYQLGYIARTEYLPEYEMSSALMINTVDGNYEAYHDEIWRAVLAAWNDGA